MLLIFGAGQSFGEAQDETGALGAHRRSSGPSFERGIYRVDLLQWREPWIPS